MNKVNDSIRINKSEAFYILNSLKEFKFQTILEAEPSGKKGDFHFGEIKNLNEINYLIQLFDTIQRGDAIQHISYEKIGITHYSLMISAIELAIQKRIIEKKTCRSEASALKNAVDEMNLSYIRKILVENLLG